MSFINKCSTILRLSNNNICNIYIDKYLTFDYYNSNNHLIYSNSLVNYDDLDFTNCYFTLDEFDNIYGIYKDDALKMLTIKKDSFDVLKQDILTFNKSKFNIIFPYIKLVNDNTHILYYVYNNDSYNTCALFHHYKHNKVWTENKIDFINHIVLDSFSVLWNNNIPTVFYFNLVDGCEEVFSSKFNINTCTWSKPIQVTNSHKNKIYLSVIKDDLNFYHLTFCENIDNGFCVKYINGYLNDSSFDIDISHCFNKPSAYRYPNIIKYNSKLHLVWVNHEKLNYCVSNDMGRTWSDINVDEVSLTKDFTRANFYSNYYTDSLYNLSKIFTTYNNIEFIGF